MDNTELARIVASDTTGATTGEHVPSLADLVVRMHIPACAGIDPDSFLAAAQAFHDACMGLYEAAMAPFIPFAELVVNWTFGAAPIVADVVGTLVLTPDTVREMG